MAEPALDITRSKGFSPVTFRRNVFSKDKRWRWSGPQAGAMSSRRLPLSRVANNSSRLRHILLLISTVLYTQRRTRHQTLASLSSQCFELAPMPLMVSWFWGPIPLGPCCLCLLIYPSGPDFVEFTMYFATTGSHAGLYITSCANYKCSYLGKLGSIMQGPSCW